MSRLFIALRPPEPLRDALLDTQEGVDGARWQGDDQLHLTLRFVGETDDRTAQDLVSALDGVEAPAFDLTVRGTGHFARKGRPSALWAALAPSPELTLLQSRIERACRAAGLPPEPRKFVPHVTLARLGGRAPGLGEWLARHGALKAPPWRVDTYRLYQSQLGKGGSVYHVLAEWALEPVL